MTDNTSVTWAAHVRILCETYHIPDPLAFLQGALLSKETWKTMVQTKITVHQETNMRRKALSNWKLNFLNIQLSGLTGRIHPILFGIKTTQDAKHARPHIKMLAGDYMCFNTLALERGSDPQCKLCLPGSDMPAPSEDIIHILTSCRGTADVRSRILPELLNVVDKFFPTCTILDTRDEHTLTQSILDCSSPNLPILTRLDPIQEGENNKG